MTCQMCKTRGKTWKGDDPTCAFEKDGEFGDNWNCATVGKIRKICYEGSPHPRVDYRYCDDQKYATVQIHDILEGGDYNASPLALWVTWYKSRGRTDAVLILFDDGTSRAPTEDELVEIIEALQ